MRCLRRGIDEDYHGRDERECASNARFDLIVAFEIEAGNSLPEIVITLHEVHEGVGDG